MKSEFTENLSLHTTLELKVLLQNVAGWPRRQIGNTFEFFRAAPFGRGFRLPEGSCRRTKFSCFFIDSAF